MSKLLFHKQLGDYSFEVYDDRPNFDVVQVNQIHSDIVIKSHLASLEYDADGIYTTNLETPLAIRTADCLPVILIGRNGVANIHAGWRGVQSKIVQSHELKELDAYLAFIGPHIRVKNYEVGEDFKKNFPHSSHFEGANFNMEAEIIDQLRNHYHNIEIQTCEICTFENEEFNSYRRNKTEKRNWNIIKRI